MALLGLKDSGLYSPWKAQGVFTGAGFLGHRPVGKMPNAS